MDLSSVEVIYLVIVLVKYSFTQNAKFGLLTSELSKSMSSQDIVLKTEFIKLCEGQTE